MDFADILKRLRIERGLSQDEMAALLGTTKQVISRYETRQRVPRISVVERFAERLGVPLSFLTGEVAVPAAEPAPAASGRRVPILGAVACGEPIFSPTDGSDYVTIDEDVDCDFALIAQGDSMTGDRIYSGDVVFIRRQSSVGDGEIAAVALDDELTLKRVRHLRGPGGRIAFTQLLPSNPAYSPIEIGGEDETRNVQILGKAIAVRFSL
ncbi:MAG: helix-turn-helix domain-containing protein [Clostridia bacterium]|nr:helix-turn-helix domain-containing protein [Clostridia bacterium]